ncbi:long-chain fatty acid--CoA ligase [Neolewinella aurantiaca]|uniref:Long-chain fatty acid--CoA ligase n=1 Tax=Neolewinella aurantiaca TaxID=2602767 RepID=A0A5C7FEK0_9BACT|nr:long-chain fatty acid--CoA ligase [Neolewinella aurantiaca]TXF89201.1 long-chain fatty acid--CoA ligase [Neolewinella aurantiaca]
MLNLSSFLEDSARRHPAKDAFIFQDTHLSYAQVNGAANQIANGLIANGIEPGDKIALSCLNVPYFPMVYFGILKAGGIVVPLSVLLKQDEVAYHLQDSDAKAYFCFLGAPGLPMLEEGHAGFVATDSCKDLYVITAKPTDPSPIPDLKTLGMLMNGQSPVAETVATSAEDTAVIIYTSGTTGQPKGAELTHSNLALNAIVSADLFKPTSEDTLLIVLPLFHIFAMTVMMNAGVYRATTNVLLPRFDAEVVLELMEKHKVTFFAGVPTMYWGLLNYQGDKVDIGGISDTLKMCLSGGASLPVKVLEDFEARFNVEILEGYGMSEGSPVVTFNQIESGRKPGSIGKPVWGVEVKIVDEDGKEVPNGEKGEIIYRGHNVTKGYYNKPEANVKTIRNGWLHSGDVGTKDEEGFFYVVDRTKDMIIRGGLNVYPREVEDVMMKHEAVSMVAVIGIPDDQYGEEVKACVVLKPGQEVSSEALREWTKERIAAYKYPRVVEFLTELPQSATGKILKKELRKM